MLYSLLVEEGREASRSQDGVDARGKFAAEFRRVQYLRILHSQYILFVLRLMLPAVVVTDASGTCGCLPANQIRYVVR